MTLSNFRPMDNIAMCEMTNSPGMPGYRNINKETRDKMTNTNWFTEDDIGIGSDIWVKPAGDTPEYTNVKVFTVTSYSPSGACARLLDEKDNYLWVDVSSFSKFWTLLDHE